MKFSIDEIIARAEKKAFPLIKSFGSHQMMDDLRAVVFAARCASGYRKELAAAEAELERVGALREGLKARIDIDNGITGGSIGPLMDVGFSMGWEHARKIVNELLAAYASDRKEGER